jgi:hypothetical protein
MILLVLDCSWTYRGAATIFHQEQADQADQLESYECPGATGDEREGAVGCRSFCRRRHEQGRVSSSTLLCRSVADFEVTDMLIRYWTG